VALPIPRTISSSAQRAVPQQEEPKKAHWLRIPHINQLRPDGANEGYVNGASFCGPAVVAMLAQGANRQPGMSDARLIQELGQGLVSRNGASPQDLVSMLERVSLPPAGPALPSVYTDAALQEHLRQGNKLIAQVEAVNPKTGERSAHYILVRGMTAEGNYRISDPLAKHPQVVTPQQLQGLVGRAPPDGGVLIPVAPPRAVSDAPRPERLRQAFQEEFRGERGVCGSFARRQEHHQFQLDIDYLGDNAERNGFRQPVLPEGMHFAEFAREILLLKQQRAPKALRLLGILQASPFARDRHVFERVMMAELRQPGIGKKTLGDSC
jgi:hypothetical protein